MRTLRGVFAACAAGLLLTFEAQPGLAQDEEPVDVTYVIVCCPGDLFWEPLIFGADLAAKHYNVNLDYQQGENDPVRINNIVETAIANDVDGIVWGITVEGAYTEVIQKARDAGIAVIISNEDEPLGAKATSRQAYVGQDFVSAGYRIARYMVKQHGLGEGDFCVTPVEESDLIYAQKRYEGTKMGLDESGVGSELLHTGGVMETSLNIIAEYLLGHPEVTCVIGLGHVPTTVIPRAMKEAGVEGLPIGGFDVGPEIMENIKAGVITGTMNQQAFWQGFMPVLFIAMWERYGLEPADFDTGAGMITPDNVDKIAKVVGTYQ